MSKSSSHWCSRFLAGALIATAAGTSCTAEDELERVDGVEYRGYDDNGGYDDGQADGGQGECEVETQRIELWPPNHALVAIDLADCIEEVKHCGDWVAEILYVTSDEPVNAQGDGNTAPDIVCVDDDTVQVRRERQGPGDGRVYRIVFAIKDAYYGYEKATGACEVVVPHDQGQGDETVDSGPSYQVSC